jgi:hypothetical protein
LNIKNFFLSLAFKRILKTEKMKNLFTTILFIALINVMSGQDYAVLRYGSKNSSYLSVGDTVLVPVYCDDITNSLFLGLEISLGYNQSVLTWLGDSYNPEPGLTGFNPVFPYNPANWNFQIDDEGIKSYWIDPMLQGVSLNSGDILFNFVFIYQGGETPLNFIQDSYIGYQWQFNTYLFDGCICDTITYPAIFHITTNGTELQGAEISVESNSQFSDSLGISIFGIPNGEYTYFVQKPGYESDTGMFAITGSTELIYVDIDVLSRVNNIGVDEYSVYPNPSNGIFYINGPKGNDRAVYCITDIAGKEVMHGVFTEISTGTIDLTDYGKGLFFMVIISESGITKRKLIVQ